MRLVCVLCLFVMMQTATASEKTNFLLLTVDDMNCDSVGVFGCKVEAVTPHIDRLASQGMRFEHAHVTIAVCQPCRAVWMTGRYPHRNGALGFQRINRGVPTLVEALQKAGYYTGVMAKTGHVVPSRHESFDVVVPASQLMTGRDPASYAKYARKFFTEAKQLDKPFFLMANAQDPHRPFAGSPQEKQRIARANRQAKGKNKKRKARTPQLFPVVENPYAPADVPVPGFLPELSEVRLEMAEYFTSVRRADAVVGAVLGELKEAGLADNTLVMFLSDHGMPLPFAKTNCYYHSTRTPWIVRWPGVVKPGSVDQEHMVSGIDLTPTVLDALGLPPLEGMDGRSFLAVLHGKRQQVRDRVFTQFHRTAGKRDYPMRCVLTREFGYIYNGWADGKTVFRNESQAGRTMKAMRAAAETDPKIAARVELFLHRVPEELYDYTADPDALTNLIASGAHSEKLHQLRGELLEHLRAAGDPLADDFAQYIAKQSKAK